jgi:dolichyl-phosphate-mannose-protein mannosyltransferase
MRLEIRLPVACRLTAAALLLLHAWMVVDLIPRWAVTHNEVGHIPAGLAYWYLGNWDLYSVNPPLPRMVATATLLNESGICLRMLPPFRGRPHERHEFEVGVAFADTNALDYQALVCRARLPGTLWVTLGGVVLWRWAVRLSGPLGGLLALSMWTIDPMVTAHAALATPDIPATVMGLSATFVFANFVDTDSWLDAFLSGLLLGLALLCKFTMLLLIPVWSVTWLVRFRPRRLSPDLATNPRRLMRLALTGFMAWLVLNAGYGFAGTGTLLEKLVFTSDSFQNLSRPFRNTAFGKLPVPVPTSYLSGIDQQQSDFEGALPSYLRGEWRPHGWWYYYLYGFAVKTPLGHLIVYGLALLTVVCRQSAVPPEVWLVPVAIIGCASIKTGFTEHVRYILPAYPFVMLASSICVSRATLPFRRLRTALIATAVTASALSAWDAYPHLLGYFNSAVGGPREGWKQLADSNVDWGQDAIMLRDWLNAYHGTQPICMAVESYVDLRVYIPRHYPAPHPGMHGYAVVNVGNVTRRFQWLSTHPIVARIGTSILVFEVGL